MDDQLRAYKVESRVLTDFAFWREATNSTAVKTPEISTGVAVNVLQRSDTSLDTSQVDSRSASSYLPFLRSCAVMAMNATGE